MDLSPNDIRSFQFSSQMRGYAREEVDNFRERVALALEELTKENLKLSTELESVRSQLAGLRQFEDTIKNAAIDARRNADQTIANAKKEAELILSKARTEAEQMVNSRAKQIEELEDQLTKLQLARKSYLSKLRLLIKSHLEVLEEVASGDVPPETLEDLDVTETREVSRRKLETIASRPSPRAVKTEESHVPDQPPTPIPVDTAVDEPAPAVTPQDAGVEPAPEPPAIDPELARALQEYTRVEQPPKSQTVPPPPEIERPPVPCEIVETTSRWDDIPEGFVTPDTEAPLLDDTDRVDTMEDQQPRQAAPPIEPRPSQPAQSASVVPPDKLAEELDRVVAKFEEEMDKADKD
ncbi:MAG: DivIVA domain-containing protein [Candidatus Zixiibacteriota bacterium]